MKTEAFGLNVILTLTLLVTGCAVGPQEQARHLDLQVNAGVLVAPDDDRVTADADAIAVSVYLVRENRLVHVTREVANPSAFLPGDTSVLESAIRAAIAGPTRAEARSGIWSAIPPGSSLLGTQLDSGVARIDLSSGFAAIGGTDEVLAVAQIVWSATALPEVDAVVLLLDGKPTSIPRADGVLISTPLTQDDYRELVGR